MLWAWGEERSEEQSSCEQVMGRRQKIFTGNKYPALKWSVFCSSCAMWVLCELEYVGWFFQAYSSRCPKTLQALGFGWAASVAWFAGALEESCRVRPGTTRPVLMWYDTNSLHRPKPVWLCHPDSSGRQQKACEEAWAKKELALPALLKRALMFH